jgi:hypothetical protein
MKNHPLSRFGFGILIFDFAYWFIGPRAIEAECGGAAKKFQVFFLPFPTHLLNPSIAMNPQLANHPPAQSLVAFAIDMVSRFHSGRSPFLGDAHPVTSLALTPA